MTEAIKNGGERYLQMVKEKSDLKGRLEFLLGMEDHPKRDKVFAFAWEEGHPYGIHEVEDIYHDLCEILSDVDDIDMGKPISENIEGAGEALQHLNSAEKGTSITMGRTPYTRYEWVDQHIATIRKALERAKGQTT